MSIMALAVVLGTVVVYSHIPKNKKGKPVDTSTWQTHTLGRTLIDLPPGAVIERRDDLIWDTPIIWRKDLTPETIQKEVEAKIAKYKAIKPHPGEYPPSMFIKTITLPNSGIRVQHWQKHDLGGYSRNVTDIDCYLIPPPKTGFKIIFLALPVTI